MKSPCLDRGDGRPCRRVNKNKSHRVCMNCVARVNYVNAIGRCPSSSVSEHVNLSGECGVVRDREIVVEQNYERRLGI
jgi:hypothetical protein